MQSNCILYSRFSPLASTLVLISALGSAHCFIRAWSHTHTHAHMHQLGWVSPQATDRGVSSGREQRSLLLSPRPCSATTFALHTHVRKGAAGTERLAWVHTEGPNIKTPVGETVEGRLCVLSGPRPGLTGERLQQSQPPDSGMEPALHVSPPRVGHTGCCAQDDRTHAFQAEVCR